MSKGPIITDKVKYLVLQVHQKHPSWKAPAIRSEANYLLRKKDPSYPKSFPSLSSIQKLLATIRKREKQNEDNPLDKLFSIGCIMAFDFPPESIPILLQMQRRIIRPMSIRQARWVSRLHIVVDKLVAENPEIWADNPALSLFPGGLTLFLAFIYAKKEQAWEIVGDSGKPFDTSDVDRLFLMPVDDKHRGEPTKAGGGIQANYPMLIDFLRLQLFMLLPLDSKPSPEDAQLLKYMELVIDYLLLILSVDDEHRVELTRVKEDVQRAIRKSGDGNKGMNPKTEGGTK